MEIDENYATTVVHDAWRTVLGCQDIRPEDDFFEVGGDSLTAIEFMESVETDLSIEFPLEVLFDSGRLADITAECTMRYYGDKK